MKLDFLKEEKEKAVQEILNSDLSKLEKLKTIKENGLWGYSDHINCEFPEWEKEAEALEKTLAEENFINKVPNKYGHIETEEDANVRRSYEIYTDSIFDPNKLWYEKYETVNYVEALEMIFDEEEEYEENYTSYVNYGKVEGSIPVITTRRLNIALHKTKEEITDRLYNFCIENKIIGFKMDW